MEKEAAVFGNRTVSGFLSQVGAEEASASDQVVWSEQSRLHLAYVGQVDANGQTNGTFTVQTDVDGNAPAGFITNHGIRQNDVVLIAQAGLLVKALVVETPTGSAVVTVEPYATQALNTLADGTATVLVVGSHYGKGQSYSDITGTAADSGRTSLQPTFQSFGNQMQIMKDYYAVSGSDASQVGWVEVSSEDGTSGYLWYLKSAGDTRARFTDYLEMTMLEAEATATNSDIGFADGQIRGAAGAGTGNDIGTQGLFDAISDRGNVTSGITGVNAATDLAEFDAILAEFDNQGANNFMLMK